MNANYFKLFWTEKWGSSFGRIEVVCPIGPPLPKKLVIEIFHQTNSNFDSRGGTWPRSGWRRRGRCATPRRSDIFMKIETPFSTRSPHDDAALRKLVFWQEFIFDISFPNRFRSLSKSRLRCFFFGFVSFCRFLLLTMSSTRVLLLEELSLV